MEIILSSKPPEQVDCDTLVLSFFQEERPLKGIAGLVDWKLQGFISRSIIDNIITGEFAEKTLIASNNLLPASKILCVGLGEGTRYSLSRLEEISNLIFQTLYKINVFMFAVSLPGVETRGLDCSRSVEHLINGAVTWAQNEGGGKAPFRVILLEKQNRFDEIMMGLYRTRIKLKKSFELEFQTNVEA